jgi:hypothetical protein
MSNSEYNLIAPRVGAVRGASVMVTPSTTTTYTLNSTNAYGRASLTVTVTVH